MSDPNENESFSDKEATQADAIYNIPDGNVHFGDTHHHYNTYYVDSALAAAFNTILTDILEVLQNLTETREIDKVIVPTTNNDQSSPTPTNDRQSSSATISQPTNVNAAVDVSTAGITEAVADLAEILGINKVNIPTRNNDQSSPTPTNDRQSSSATISQPTNVNAAVDAYNAGITEDVANLAEAPEIKNVAAPITNDDQSSPTPTNDRQSSSATTTRIDTMGRLGPFHPLDDRLYGPNGWGQWMIFKGAGEVRSTIASLYSPGCQGLLQFGYISTDSLEGFDGPPGRVLTLTEATKVTPGYLSQSTVVGLRQHIRQQFSQPHSAFSRWTNQWSQPSYVIVIRVAELQSTECTPAQIKQDIKKRY